MKKYAILLNEETKQCAVGMGPDADVYTRMGMTEMDVEEGPDGNWYLAGYAPAGPTEAELLERAKAVKAGEFDAAMAATDRALVRPVSDLIGAVVAPALMNAEELDEAGDGGLSAAELETSRRKFAALRELQIKNRALRARMLAAKTVDEVRAISPATLDSPDSPTEAPEGTPKGAPDA